jgi:hypothetical protein
VLVEVCSELSLEKNSSKLAIIAYLGAFRVKSKFTGGFSWVKQPLTSGEWIIVMSAGLIDPICKFS